MGVIGKVATRGLVKAQPAPVGPWMDQLSQGYPLLDRKRSLGAALIRALVDLDVGKSTSSFLFDNEKKPAPAALALRAKQSVVRIDVGTLRLRSGALGHGWFTADWTLQVGDDGSQNTDIDVIQYRMLNDSVNNSKLLRDARTELSKALLNGPGHVSVTETGSQLEHLVEQAVLPATTTFAGDHLEPIPSTFVDGARIPLPLDSVGTLREIMTGGLFATTAGRHGGIGISLDGGRGVACAIDLIEGEQPGLVLRLAPEGDMARQRTFRATMRHLGLLVLVLGRDGSDAVRPISEHLSRWSPDLNTPGRYKRFLPAYGDDHPVGSIVLRKGAALPLTVRIRTTINSDDLDAYIKLAQTWLIRRERSWTIGLRKKSREEAMTYLMRGPSQVKVDGTKYQMVRYGDTSAQAFEHGVLSDDTTPWFWQVNFLHQPLPDGRREVTLATSSLSRTDNILCYGQELARLLGAFEWLVRTGDPSAEFETTSLVI